MRSHLAALTLLMLVACSDLVPDETRGAGSQQVKALAESELEVVNSEFHTLYEQGLWAIMSLEFCKPQTSSEGKELMTRWNNLTSEAFRMGLEAELKAAADEKAKQMAKMKIDITCREGLATAIGRATPIVAELESMLNTTAKGV